MLIFTRSKYKVYKQKNKNKKWLSYTFSIRKTKTLKENSNADNYAWQLRKGITEGRLKLLFYSIGQEETEGVVSVQWVGTNKFVNYSGMLHMLTSEKKWQIFIAELFFNCGEIIHLLDIALPQRGPSVVSPLQFKNL